MMQSNFYNSYFSDVKENIPREVCSSLSDRPFNAFSYICGIKFMAEKQLHRQAMQRKYET